MIKDDRKPLLERLIALREKIEKMRLVLDRDIDTRRKVLSEIVRRNQENAKPETKESEKTSHKMGCPKKD